MSWFSFDRKGPPVDKDASFVELMPWDFLRATTSIICATSLFVAATTDKATNIRTLKRTAVFASIAPTVAALHIAPLYYAVKTGPYCVRAGPFSYSVIAETVPRNDECKVSTVAQDKV